MSNYPRNLRYAVNRLNGYNTNVFKLQTQVINLTVVEDYLLYVTFTASVTSHLPVSPPILRVHGRDFRAFLFLLPFVLFIRQDTSRAVVQVS